MPRIPPFFPLSMGILILVIALAGLPVMHVLGQTPDPTNTQLLFITDPSREEYEDCEYSDDHRKIICNFSNYTEPYVREYAFKIQPGEGESCDPDTPVYVSGTLVYAASGPLGVSYQVGANLNFSTDVEQTLFQSEKVYKPADGSIVVTADAENVLLQTALSDGFCGPGHFVAVWRWGGHPWNPQTRSGTIIISLDPEEEEHCWDRYRVGDQLVSDSVKAYNEPALGPLMQGVLGKPLYLEGGRYYMIETTDPPWLNGDGHPATNSYLGDLTSSWVLGAGSSEWCELSQCPGVCVQPLENGKARVYFYAEEQHPASPYLHGVRAHDPAGNWDNNEGALHYTVSEAYYTPPPEACESRFLNQGLVNSGRIRADFADGGPIFMHTFPQPGQTYMLEISGNPWYDNQIPSHAVDISYDNGLTWLPISEVNTVCVATPGANVYRFYFKHEANRSYRLRAHDGDGVWLNNTGYVEFDLYQTFDFRPEGSCASRFTLGSEIKTGSTPATNSNGKEITFVPEQWYAIEVKEPAWTDNGVEMKSAQITGDHHESPTWHELPNFPGAACAETVNGYQRIYFKAQYDYYLYRANDTDGDWANNAGDVNYRIYGVSVEDPTAPIGSCESNYNSSRVLVSTETLWANLANGLKLSLQPGKYVIETSEGPWLNESTPSYDVEITNGGIAGSYVPVSVAGTAPPLECVVALSDGNHYRAYFSVYQGDDMRVRVLDLAATYGTNSGFIKINIYKVTSSGEAPPEPGDYTITGCNSLCERPDSVLELADWLEYQRCAFSKYIAFCPYHTAALASMVLEFDRREPFSTILQFTTLPAQIREQFRQYDWAQDVGGDSAELMSEAQPWDFLASLPPDSPYRGGQITIKKPIQAFSTFCEYEMSEAVGERLGAPICFAMNVLNAIGGTKWMQWVFDLVLIAVFGVYLFHYIKSL